MKKFLFLVLMICTCGQGVAQTMNVADARADTTFSTTKAGVRWWWLGSAVDDDNLRWCLQQYADAGIGAVEITPLYGVKGNEANELPFLSPRWMHAMQTVIDEGRRLGIRTDMNLGTGWPFGGPLVTIDEAACKAVFVVDTVMTGAPAKKAIAEKERPYAQLLCERRYPLDSRHEQVIQLYQSRTRQKVKRAAPGGEGYVIDHFSRQAVRHYLDRFDHAFADSAQCAMHNSQCRIDNSQCTIDNSQLNGSAQNHFSHLSSPSSAEGLKLGSRDRACPVRNQDSHHAYDGQGTPCPYLRGEVISCPLPLAPCPPKSAPYPYYFFNDSYEVYHANWTPTLLDEFARRRGYRLEEHLRELLGLVDDGNQVLCDYRETLSDLLLENFTRQWTDWAHSHGVQTRNQAHGSPANLIDLYAAVDVPEIEGFGLTDFGIKGLRTDPGMTRENYSDVSMLKYASSAAHITGKPLTSSETFTWLTEHFRTSLSQMKPDLDLMFTCGVNHVFFHGAAYSPKDEPWPGWKFYASIDMSPTNSIWRDAPYLMTYIDRCQQRLQAGRPDNDFLVYLPVYDMWRRRLTEGEAGLLMPFDIHSMKEKAPDFIHAVMQIDSLGYDCDYISDRYLLNTTYSDGMLQTAAGTRYHALVIPGSGRMTDALRTHLDSLQRQGAVIIRGFDAERMSRAAKAEPMRRDCHLRAIRRACADGHLYFIANLTPHDIDTVAPLAVSDTQGDWYDPMTDRRSKAVFTTDGVHIRLRSGESRFLKTCDGVAPQPYTHCLHNSKRQMKGNDKKTGKKDMKTPAEIDLTHRPWSLHFIESAPAVNRTFRLDSLQTWETLDDDSVRVTMGTGVYTTTFRLTKKEAQQHWRIHLGDVRESARVYINGTFIGCAWAVPFTLDCGDALRRGDNELRIEVTNLPANRIAHLDRQGVQWRRFKEINFVDINYKKTTYEKWPPMPSGLNSTVTLSVEE